MVGGASQGAREGGADGSETGRFELFIVGLEGGLEIGGTDVNLARKVDGFARGGADHITNNHKGDKSKDGASDNFDD